MNTFDRAVRASVYRRFIDGGATPTAAGVARALDRPVDEVLASFRRLADAHLLVLRPGGDAVWMAHPFSGVATPFPVTTPRGDVHANCAWDALGVAALLAVDTTCRTPCPDGCGATLDLSVRDGAPVDPSPVVHFVVPARRFWDDIGFT